MFLRFVRFNVVGAMGVAVQIAALTLLVSGLGVHYLPATALAIEVSVLHNFLWHERWTWRDRTGRNAECRMQNAECRMQKATWTRLVAFHAGNGLVSMAGSLVLMPVFVAWLGLHYIVANLGIIAATGLFNFLLGDRVIFTAPSGGDGGGGVFLEVNQPRTGGAR